MSNLHCASCDATLPAEANFCPQCGARFVPRSASAANENATDEGAGDSETVATVMMSTEDVFAMLDDDDGKDRGSSVSSSDDDASGDDASDDDFSVQSGSIMFKPAPDPDDVSTAHELPSVAVSDGTPDAETSSDPGASPPSSSAQTQYDMPILNRDIRATPPAAAGDQEPAKPLSGTHLGVPVPKGVADAALEDLEDGDEPRGPAVLEAVMEAPTRQLDLETLRKERAMRSPTRQVDLSTLRKKRGGDRSKGPTGPARSPLEMPVLKLHPEPKPAAPPPDDVPTRFEMPALTMEDIDKLRRAAADDTETVEGEDGPDAIATTPESEGIPEDTSGKRAFSETQWFRMGAVVDADLLESVEPSEYDRDDSIRTGERKKFSLRDLEDDD